MMTNMKNYLIKSKLQFQKQTDKKKIGIAFSGGVDSTLISKICTDLGYDITLLTIGFSESHDILFAKEVNELLNYPHHVLEIESNLSRNFIKYS